MLLAGWPAVGNYGQTIPSGLYKIQHNDDTGYLHRYHRPYAQKDLLANISRQVTDISSYRYSSLIDTAFNAGYALVQAIELKGSSTWELQIVLFNKAVPKRLQEASPGEGRKYIQLQAALDPHLRIWQYRQSGYTTDGKSFYQDRLSDDHLYVDERLRKKYIGPQYFIDGTDGGLLGTYYTLTPDSVTGTPASTRFIFNRGATVFQLQEPLRFTGLLPVQRVTRLYTGKQPRDTTAYRMLAPGDFIAVTRKQDEWITGYHIDEESRIVTGSIFIDDLNPTGAQTASKTIGALHLVTCYVPPYQENNYSEEGYIVNIKVYKNNQLLQVIQGGGLVTDTNNILRAVDVNFDGHPDLEIYAANGGAGPNYANNYYIFSPATGRYVYHEAMSELSQPFVNEKTKSVHAASRAGAGQYRVEKYKWIQQQLTLVEFVEVFYRGDGEAEQAHFKRINGKMKGKTRRVPEAQAFPDGWDRNTK